MLNTAEPARAIERRETMAVASFRALTSRARAQPRAKRAEARGAITEVVVTAAKRGKRLRLIPVAAPVIARPKISQDVEVRGKISQLQRRLARNLGLLHDKVDNLRTTIFDPRTTGYIFDNALSLTSRRVEGSALGSPIPGLRFNAGATTGAGYSLPCNPTRTAAEGWVINGVTWVDVQDRQFIDTQRATRLHDLDSFDQYFDPDSFRTYGVPLEVQL